MEAHRHGHAGKKPSRTYQAWSSMLARCKYPANENYSRYGGKGVTVCDRWRGALRPGKKNRYGGFAAFLQDMGECPGPDHQLHRLDTMAGYEPANCQWLSRSDHAWLTSRMHHARHVGVIR